MAIGDIAIYRESGGGQSVTASSSSSPDTLLLDTTVREDSIFSLSSGVVTVSEAGLYLLCYSTDWAGVDTSTIEYHVRMAIAVNGTTELMRGEANCWGDDVDLADVESAMGCVTLFNLSASDTVEVAMWRVDGNGGTLSMKTGDGCAGFTIVKVGNASATDPPRVHLTGFSWTLPGSSGDTFAWDNTDLTNASAWTEIGVSAVTGDASDLGSGQAFESSGGGYRVQLSRGGRYFVAYGIKFSTGGNLRNGLLGCLLNNGSTLDYTYSGNHMEDPSTGAGGVVRWAGIIDVTAGDDISLGARQCRELTTDDMDVDDFYLYVVELPTSVEAFSLIQDTNDIEDQVSGSYDLIPGDSTAWDANEYVDSACFTETTTTPGITVGVDDGYVFFASGVYGEDASNTRRKNPYLHIAIDTGSGEALGDYGQDWCWTRGASSGQDIVASAVGCAWYSLDGSNGDDVRLAHYSPNRNTEDNSRQWIHGGVRFQGLRVSTLASAAVTPEPGFLAQMIRMRAGAAVRRM